MSETALVMLLVVFAFLTGAGFAAVCASAAYRNGVTDGYGYSREPNCPGYAAAGKWLRENMAHRWWELRDDAPKARIVPPQGGSGTAPPQCKR